MARLLVVDDNPDVLDAMDLLLGLHGHTVQIADTEKAALMVMSAKPIDMVIQDMNFTQDLTSGSEGKSLFYQLRRQYPKVPVVLMTAWTQLETAIELVKAGAADYLPKPWNDDKLLALITQHVSERPVTTSPSVIFHSQAMQALMAQAAQVARAEANVLITGENGCGKEVLADYIQQHSQRASKPFLKVNVGALPADLMEAELFGAEKGAFTGANAQRIGRFEAADGGTLFLDEIGNLSLPGQMKLLRVLQTGEFERLGSNHTLKADVRVICATNADLPTLVKQGHFREDLWFRLNVFQLRLPPLAQRKDDIMPLTNHFLGAQYVLTPEAEHALRQYSWPGNVRELQNACERAKVFAQGNRISAADFQVSNTKPEVDEKTLIENTLRQQEGVIKLAADALGLSRQALYRRIEKYQINVDNL